MITGIPSKRRGRSAAVRFVPFRVMTPYNLVSGYQHIAADN
jgi:hypothetical protein